MRTLPLGLALLTLLAGSIAYAADVAKPPPFALRWVAEKASANTEELIETVDAMLQGVPPSVPTDIVCHVEKDVLLDGSALSSAHVRKDDSTAQPQVLIKFTPQGRARFAEITRQANERGKKSRRIAILIDGKILSIPRIHGEVPQGEVVISRRLDQAEAERLAQYLNRVAAENP